MEPGVAYNLVSLSLDTEGFSVEKTKCTCVYVYIYMCVMMSITLHGINANIQKSLDNY